MDTASGITVTSSAMEAAQEHGRQAGHSPLRLYMSLLCAGGCTLIIGLLAISGADAIWIYLAVGVTVVAAAVAWEMISRLVIEPIARLGSRTGIVASGESLQIIEPPADAGLARLVEHFNALTHRVREETGALTELRRTIDGTRQLREQVTDLEERYSNTIALSEIGQQITSSLSLEEILTTTYQSINAMMDAAAFGLGVYDDGRQCLRFSLSIEQGERLPEYTIAIEDRTSFAAWCARNRREVFLNDVERDHARYVDGVGTIGSSRIPQSAIFAPMCIGERLIGVICIQSFRKNAYSEHHLNMARTLASYTAIAHDHAHAYHELNRTHQDLKEAQLQIIQSEKMASLGQLTAGIAHEINNPINFVSANVKPLGRDINDLLRLLERYEELQPGNDVEGHLAEIEQLKQEIDLTYLIDEIRQLLKGIEDGATRTAEIVRGLRNFSRLDEAELKHASLHEGIDSTLVLLHNTYKGRIEIVKDYGDLPDIECYPGQLNQVFMNLLTNAVQAIPDNGTITVSTRRIGDEIEIRISDTGSGIPKDIRDKIFDPFFTTKEVGKGTGLGLSISIGIIQKHHGTINVDSEVGTGTTFVITLPIRQH